MYLSMHKNWSWLVRMAGAGISLMGIGLFVTSIPFRYRQLLSVIPEARVREGQLTPQLASSFAEVGLSVGVYATWVVVVEIIIAAVYCSLAGLIIWRKSKERMGFLVALMLLIVGTASTPLMLALTAARPAWGTAVQALRATEFVLIILFLYTFPDGRFVPPWTRWAAALVGCLGFGSLFIPVLQLPAGLVTIETPSRDIVIFLNFLFWVSTGAIAQGYRYFKISTPLQQQQTKWVVFGMAAVVTLIALVTLPLITFPPLRQVGIPNTIYRLVGVLLGFLSLLIIPVILAVSILRYRLWDIDILIRRTVQYSVITAAMALVFIASIIVLQRFFRVLTGQESELAVVSSTLIIAALFVPIRSRLQVAVDRRFYRQKYNAQNTLEKFALDLREEVDLDELSKRLINIVKETMQPEHVSLWIKSTSGKQVSQRFIIQSDDRSKK